MQWLAKEIWILLRFISYVLRDDGAVHENHIIKFRSIWNISHKNSNTKQIPETIYIFVLKVTKV